MDFKAQNEEIKNYIESHLPLVLQRMNLADFDEYVDDFLDFDKYKKSATLFYNFGLFNYDDLTNESEVEDFEFTIYMVFRNNKRSVLKDYMLDYSTAFYTMFDESERNLGGVSDYGKITTIGMYPAPEGNPDMKIVELTIHLYTEKC